MTSLVSHPRGVVFADLKELCHLTDGNLSRHLQVLHEAGFVEIWKGFHQNRPQTLCRLTDDGRRRFLEYINVLETVVQDALKAARIEPTPPTQPPTSPRAGRPPERVEPVRRVGGISLTVCVRLDSSTDFDFVSPSYRSLQARKGGAMRVIRAEVMGLCFGVRDALEVVEAIEEPEAVTIHGQLVHNEVVQRRLGRAGLRDARMKRSGGRRCRRRRPC